MASATGAGELGKSDHSLPKLFCWEIVVRLPVMFMTFSTVLSVTSRPHGLSLSVTSLFITGTPLIPIFLLPPIGTWRASLVAQKVKNLPAMQETWVWSLGWGSPLEKGMATHSNIFAWRIPWTDRGVCGGLQSMGSQRVEHNWLTNTVGYPF